MPVRREYYEENWTLYLQCKKCGKFKSADMFYKHKVCFMWLSSICKECDHKYWIKYHEEHREQQNKRNRENRDKNKDKINETRRRKYRDDAEYKKLCSEKSKIWRDKNREQNLRHHKEYYEQNRDKISEKGKEYYSHNKEYINARNREYCKTHRDILNKASSLWKKNNRDKMNVYQQWLRERRWPLYSKAHRLAEKQLKKIWLKRDKCPICWQEWIVVCHHPSYDKPYEVVPCCNLCHSQIHRWEIGCPQPIDLFSFIK